MKWRSFTIFRDQVRSQWKSSIILIFWDHVMICSPYQSYHLDFSPSLRLLVFHFWGHGLPCSNLNMNNHTSPLNRVLPPKLITHRGSKTASSHRCWFKLFYCNHFPQRWIKNPWMPRWGWLECLIFRDNVGQCFLQAVSSLQSPGNISMGFNLNLVYMWPLIFFTKSCQPSGV